MRRPALRRLIPALQALTIAASVSVSVAMTAPAWSDFLITRAFQDNRLSSTVFQRLYSSKIDRTSNTLSVATEIMLNAPLADNQQVWIARPVKPAGQLVYGAFDPNDSAFDALFVVGVQQPGVVRQLNPPRDNPATDAITSIATNVNSTRVVYVVTRNSGNPAATDTLYLADTRNPGQATLVAALPAGNLVDGQFIMSDDGSVVAYRVQPPTGARGVVVTFLNSEANFTPVFNDPNLSDYAPTELAFSEDGSRLLWIDDGFSNEPGPLRSVDLDTVNADVGTVILASAGNLTNERVSEFEIRPGTNNVVAYRSFAANSTLPADTWLINLNSPGTATQLNLGPFNGAEFTNFEDVEWRDNRVLYNASEDLLTLADLFSVSQNDPADITQLSALVPFAMTSGNNANGISHFVQSPNNNKTAMIDGDPALNLFIIDRLTPATWVEPFNMSAARTLTFTPADPNQAAFSITDPNELPPRFSPGSDMIAMTIGEDSTNNGLMFNLYAASSTGDASERAVLNGPSPEVFEFYWLADGDVPDNQPTAMAAAVLPASRSGQVGSTLTAFATMINGGSVTAQDCAIELIANIPASLAYQTTDPTTNGVIGSANTPVDILPGQAQSFVVSITLNNTFASRDAEIAFLCRNANAVTPVAGLNTLRLSSSNGSVPDIIALAATAPNDGIVRLDGAGNGAFSVASVNVGDGATIEVSADTSTGASVALCESDPVTAVCVNPTAPTFNPVQVNITTNGTPTFSVFPSSTQTIAPDAANNRVRVVFTDSSDQIRGQTSVAIQSGP